MKTVTLLFRNESQPDKYIQLHISLDNPYDEICLT